MDFLDRFTNEITNPAATSGASAKVAVNSFQELRSPIPSAARREKQAIFPPSAITKAPASQSSAPEPRTSATTRTRAGRESRSSNLSGASRGAETIIPSGPIERTSPLHHSRESGADQAKAPANTDPSAPDRQPSPATGSDEANAPTQTRVPDPRRQKSPHEAATLAAEANEHPPSHAGADEAAQVASSAEQLPRQQSSRPTDQAAYFSQPIDVALDLSDEADEAIRHVHPDERLPRQRKSARKSGSVSGQPASEDLVRTAADASHPVVDGARDGHSANAPHIKDAVTGDIILSIRADWRTRQRWHKAEKSLTLQAMAYCRGWVEDGDKDKAGKLYKAFLEGEQVDPGLAALLDPYRLGAEMFEQRREAVEKSLAKTAKKLPVFPFVKATFGASPMTLASIVGEAGDVGSYKSVSALWKRMGLAVFDGRPQGRTSPDASAADKKTEFVVHGYSPVRRSVVWNIGNGLIGGMGRGPRLAPGEDPNARDDLSPYQKLFVERIRYEAERGPAHRRPDTIKKETGEVRESFSKHAANRAKRYVEKRFLRDLYAAWRAADGQASCSDPMKKRLGGETPA